MNTRPSFRSLAALAALTFATASADPFQPGDILLTNFSGDYAQQYSSTGTLLETFTGTSGAWVGNAVTPGGLLAISRQSPGVNLYDSAGTEVDSFATPGIGNTFDLSVFANGTLAINDQPGGLVHRYTQAGAFLGSVTMTGMSGLLGSTVGIDNILYVAGGLSNNIGRVSQAGTFLGSVAIPFAPLELVMNPLDGTLWATSNAFSDTIYHLTTTGTVLGSFSAGLGPDTFYGLGMAPDGQSLYVTGANDAVIRHIDLNGTPLGDFPIVGFGAGFNTFMTVIVPEPGSALLLAGGGLGLLLRRRR